MNLAIPCWCKIEPYRIWKEGEPVFQLASAGDFDGFVKQAYRQLNLQYPKFFKMDRLSKLAFLASEVVLKGMPSLEEREKENFAVVLANSAGSLDTDASYWETVADFPSPGLFVYTLPNIAIGEICIRNQFKGENAFFVMENFDPEWMARYVETLFITRGASGCLAGWVEVLRERFEGFVYLVTPAGGTSQRPHNAEILKQLYSSKTEFEK